jgi:hypothetical protein
MSASLASSPTAADIVDEIRERTRAARVARLLRLRSGNTAQPDAGAAAGEAIPAPAACAGVRYTYTRQFGLCPYADAGLQTVGVFPLGGLTWCGPF